LNLPHKTDVENLDVEGKKGKKANAGAALKLKN
jgi:hypothetical protein